MASINSIAPDPLHAIALAMLDAIERDALRAYTNPQGPAALGMVQPSHDEYTCEICDDPVAEADRSGFAARHGAICHVNCISAQMNHR